MYSKGRKFNKRKRQTEKIRKDVNILCIQRNVNYKTPFYTHQNDKNVKSDSPKHSGECGGSGITILESNLATSDKVEDEHFLQSSYPLLNKVSKETLTYCRRQV